ncbi:MAG: DNA primase [Candidatus Bathyarchaeia archaeon]
MSQYITPEGMRPATLTERKEFYTQEFDLPKVAEWLRTHRGRTKFAVIIGRHTKIFPPEYREDADTTIIIDEYKDLADVRCQIVEFLPEAAYYDRNSYNAEGKVTGQELAFDLDPENITCPIHGTLADKMKRRQGLGFCDLELDMVKGQTLCLLDFLEKQFSQLRVVYSGRGFHIHVLDAAAYALDARQRRRMAKAVKVKGFGIDEWVTVGEMRLIRLPYSLNGLVSRVALPLGKTEIENFSPITDARCIPEFLRGKPSTSS